MPQSVVDPGSARHRVIGEMRPKMLKAIPVKGESVDYLLELGECLDCARHAVGWTVDQLAGELGRDSKQVARWMRGEERTQVDRVLAVYALRWPFIAALARLCGHQVDETITRRHPLPLDRQEAE